MQIQTRQVIVVTGANKAYGFGIVKYLAQYQKYDIVMACKDIQKGKRARANIKEEPNQPKARLYVQEVNLADSNSIDVFVHTLRSKYQQIHLLINSAGVSVAKSRFDIDAFDWTFKTNFYGTIEFVEKMIPLMRKNSKILISGSSFGRQTYNHIPSSQIKHRLKSIQQKKDLFVLIQQFKESIKQNKIQQKGWLPYIYGMSKLAINIYTKILGQYPQIIDKEIQVYAYCTGYQSKDMETHKGKSIEQGIKTPLFLISLPHNIYHMLQGEFFQNQAKSSTFEEK